ncbi:MAG: acyl-CoA dehydrogenase family protein [Balneolaceae bacterium]|nr:acyl-CoA dehydrogenase family protein [Balneolaceae bacterium]
MPSRKNQVLTDDARKSSDFYSSDLILKQYLDKHLSAEANSYMRDRLQVLGREASAEMEELSMKADRHSPQLKRRDPLGEQEQEVEFHPAYWELMDIAARSEMFYVKYDPELRNRFHGERHRMGYASGQIYAMSELSQYCPHCMTDGAAHLVDRYASQEDTKRLLPRLSARTGDDLYTGAMFLTEKSGGSDVGANLTEAERIDEERYRLNGEKWFCSNVNAEVIMALARTGPLEKGTRGLSLFLVEKQLPDGSRNPMEIIRLKEKLGVRSMATGEVRFTDTIGKRLGEEGNGFKLMAEMINISRLYNSVAAIAGSRRAIIEAWQYLNHRITFGKRATEHPLVREKFRELGSRYLAGFLLTWRAIRAMDNMENGDEEEKELFRMVVPMAKWWTAENAVYTVRECMELMGGNGYIEDFVMPRLLRDVNVLPIWEGSGNIIVLDMLRASEKSEGMEMASQAISKACDQSSTFGGPMKDEMNRIIDIWNMLKAENRETVETTAKPLFMRYIHLYQMALLIDERDEESKAWIDPALMFMAEQLDETLSIKKPLGLNRLSELIGWEY